MQKSNIIPHFLESTSLKFYRYLAVQMININLYKFKNNKNSMKFLPLAIVVFLIIQNIAAQSFPTFEQYIVRFNKSYSDSDKLIRKTIYDNVIGNVLPLLTDYTVGVNNFTDWTVEQINSLKGLLVLSNRGNSDTIDDSQIDSPASLDWRTSNAVTEPKNQGRCGSCWAFASAAYAQSKLIIANQYANDIDLSEQRILECTQQSSCDGGYLQYAMQSLKNTVPRDSVYQYTGNQTQGGNICTISGIQIGNGTQDYYDLTGTQLEDLLTQSPVTIAVDATNWEYYSGGIFKSTTRTVNHAVLLIGYTQDYWIIKNSWGTNWGQDGYIRVSRTPNQDCQVGVSAHRTTGEAMAFQSFYSLSFICFLLIILTIA